ncbi:MAG: PD40 domain-containing protein, partial [Leptospiraceae bacterium]|nr:PD40 domain-containing protein [Leptospiraceae bacterium]
MLGCLLPIGLPGQDVDVSRKVENLGLPNWAGQDYAPSISPDGRFLIFQSDRPGKYENQNLWFSINSNSAQPTEQADWSVPVPLFLPMEGEPSRTMQILEDGEPPGTFTINSDGFEGMASLVYRTDDENRLRPVEIYFTSYKDDQSKRDGYEGLNIYFSRYRDSRWSRPEHLNIINSDFDDRMPHVSHDGRYMYFVSNRPGGYGGNDIWMSQRDL